MEQAPKTPRGEDYRRTLHLADRRKLVNARDMEGEPTLVSPKLDEEYGNEAHEVLRTLHRELGTQESFVGVTLIGSLVRGHSNESSDLDVRILEDTAEGNAVGKINQICVEELAKLREKGILKRKVHHEVIGLSSKALKRLLPQEPRNDDFPQILDEVQVMRSAIVALCSPMVGPKVQEYRHMVGNYIQEMPPAQALKLLKDLAATAMTLEEHSHHKRVARIPALKNRNKDKADRARVVMWYKRIATALELVEKK